MDFDEWWQRTGKDFVGTPEDLARLAFIVSKGQSTNYTTDDPEVVRVVTFANGRMVSASEGGTLNIGWIDRNG